MSEKLSESTLKTKLEKKLEDIHYGFAGMVNGLTKADLEQQMFTLAKYREETDLALKEDEQILSIAAQLKELKAPYNDQLNSIKLKLQYINLILTEKYSQPTETQEQALSKAADELLGE